MGEPELVVMSTTTREYRCAVCRRKLRPERWVFSSHTGNRYCLPGEGCETQAAIDRRLRKAIHGLRGVRDPDARARGMIDRLLRKKGDAA